MLGSVLHSLADDAVRVVLAEVRQDRRELCFGLLTRFDQWQPNACRHDAEQIQSGLDGRWI
jgi:hypothetical protein